METPRRLSALNTLLLARLDSTPSPVVGLRELPPHTGAELNELKRCGVLVDAGVPEEIVVEPGRTLRIKKIGANFFGFDDDEECPRPQKLTPEDVTQYRIAAPAFVAHLVSLNQIEGISPASSPALACGLLLIGRKSTPDGLVNVWLVLALGSEPATIVGRLAQLAMDDAHARHVTIFPRWPSLSPSDLSALSEKGVHLADLDPVSLRIRWPDALRRDAAPTVPDYALIHEGATWRVHFLGDCFTILDKTGVTYLARLLHDPANSWTALEVQRGYRTAAPRQTEAKPEDGTELSDQMENPLHASEGQGVARLRRLLTPLRNQIAEAERTGDVVGEREARAALAKLLPGANQVIGRDDRSRVSGAAEKARKNVSKQINQALDAIEQSREPVARHIRDHLTLGLSMTYSPTRGEAWHVVFPKS